MNDQMMTESKPVECPFCHQGNVVAVARDVPTGIAKTSGLFFELGERRVVTGRGTVAITHRKRRGDVDDNWVCRGETPAGWVMP